MTKIIKKAKTKARAKPYTRNPTASPQTDVILPMQEPYMTQIVSGEKNYEFRKYLLKPSVERIWFYRTAPHSSIEYICEIEPAVTRNPGDPPLVEDKLGNKEFNERHEETVGWDFAYRIRSVYRIGKAVTLKDLKENHGMGLAPRGMVYTPRSLLDCVDWRVQERLL